MMKRLFKRKEVKEEFLASKKADGLSYYLEKVYQYLKEVWVQWMTTQESKISYRKQILIWVLFICGVCGYSAYLISSGLTQTASDVININPIIRPLDILKYDDDSIARRSTASQYELGKITQLWEYLDSLALHPSTIKSLESIKQKTPGLLDSLVVLENYYQTNQKKYDYGN